jgi:hypothetical protein
MLVSYLLRGKFTINGLILLNQENMNHADWCIEIAGGNVMNLPWKNSENMKMLL